MLRFTGKDTRQGPERKVRKQGRWGPPTEAALSFEARASAAGAASTLIFLDDEVAAVVRARFICEQAEGEIKKDASHCEFCRDFKKRLVTSWYGRGRRK